LFMNIEYFSQDILDQLISISSSTASDLVPRYSIEEQRRLLLSFVHFLFLCYSQWGETFSTYRQTKRLKWKICRRQSRQQNWFWTGTPSPPASTSGSQLGLTRQLVYSTQGMIRDLRRKGNMSSSQKINKSVS
jgi:hypothetical protein